MRSRELYQGRDIRVAHRKVGLSNQYLTMIDDEVIEPATFDDEHAALRFARALIDDEGVAE